ncbi:hypothetical protein BDV39DRAFT_206778 [Aspergillus sergii]|uniref:F-box domain-containing protein n=1 Tax=Aspergillus sergii TaxID=1034303 RepID=A0A5N6X011_9EURO|nr:hypothetical protein BDV39DRAFT_206778 [Aspergillus sergii]
MPSSTEQTFSIYELAEHIFLQLNDQVEIISAQRVCRNWRDVIQTSPILQEACWYQSSNTGVHTWKLNPAFNRIGVSISKDIGHHKKAKDGLQEKGDFSLRERIYDTPGSWTTMLATQPPCQRMLVECYGDYCDDDIIFYQIVSMSGCLLMGDIMAILAECQNRQQYGLDRWGGVIHYTGRLLQWDESKWDESYWVTALERMPDSVSIKVAIELPWGAGGCPGFSLRRLDGSKDFLHEMILHKMILEGGQEYQNEYGDNSRYDPEYKPNLLVVREHQEGYLSDSSNIFRLLSDVG